MRAADVPAVTRLERAVFRRDAWPRGAFALLAAVFAIAEPPRGRLWVAEASARRIGGYAGVELSLLGGEADVINLAVAPARRRQGIGRRLLEATVRFCEERGVALIWLRVRASNRGARAFYRRCGFRPVGRFRRYYADPTEDAILMARAPWARPRPGRPWGPPSAERRRAGARPDPPVAARR